VTVLEPEIEEVPHQEESGGPSVIPPEELNQALFAIGMTGRGTEMRIADEEDRTPVVWDHQRRVRFGSHGPEYS
jgi:hypothetical protein